MRGQIVKRCIATPTDSVADLKWLGGIHWHRAIANLKVVIHLKENDSSTILKLVQMNLNSLACSNARLAPQMSDGVRSVFARASEATTYYLLCRPSKRVSMDPSPLYPSYTNLLDVNLKVVSISGWELGRCNVRLTPIDVCNTSEPKSALRTELRRPTRSTIFNYPPGGS